MISLSLSRVIDLDVLRASEQRQRTRFATCLEVGFGMSSGICIWMLPWELSGSMTTPQMGLSGTVIRTPQLRRGSRDVPNKASVVEV